LALNASLRAGDLSFDKDKIKLVTDPQAVLAHVVTLRVEEEKPAEAVAGATPAEPEVIKKGKKEVEGEEGAEAAGDKGGDKGGEKKK
jgi:large subunit ribosomal protein L25